MAGRRLRSHARCAVGHVARTLSAWMRHAVRLEIEMRPVEVNGRAGFLGLDAEGRVIFVMALEAGESNIEYIHSVVNPDKLRHLEPRV